MANSYKDIIITPNRSNTADPKIEFRGANSSVNTTMSVYTYPTSNGTISFEGSAGQLFSITNDLTGSIYSVNDVSGIPSIEVFANGQIDLAAYGGNVRIGSDVRVQRSYSSANTPLSVLNTTVASKRQTYDTAIFQSEDAPSLRITEVDGSTSAVIGELTLSGGDGNVQVIGSTGDIVFAAGRSAGEQGWTTSGERMRVTTYGFIGIGTTGPGWLIDAQETYNGQGGIAYTNLSTGASSAGQISCEAGGSYFYHKITRATGVVQFRGITATTLNQDFNTQIFRSTGGTERMRLDSNGKLLIGTTSVTSASVTGLLQVESEIFSKGSLAGLFFENRSGGVTSTTNWYGWYNTGGTTYFYNGSANIASINSSTGAYTALSDRNKKKDFSPSTLGLEAIMALQPTEYRMKDDAPDAPKQLGFIAQDVKDHIPQAYVETEDFIGLNDRAIIATLVKAVQELTARVAQLEGK